MTSSEQFCLLPQRSDQRASALHRAQMSAGAMLEIAEVTSAEVRHGVMLEVTPDVLDGIELGSVGRQILQGDAAVESVEILLNQRRAMCLQAIPDDQQLLADGRLQGLEEVQAKRPRPTVACLACAAAPAPPIAARYPSPPRM